MAYYGWANDPDVRLEPFERYVAMMSDVAAGLLADGHVIRVLIGERSDQRAVDRLMDDLRACQDVGSVDGSVVVQEVSSFADLMNGVAQTDVVVATRFHNVVASLMLGRPTVSVGYAAKNADLMTQFGQGEHCHHVETATAESILEDVRFVVLEASGIATSMAHIADRYADVVNEYFSEAFGLIDRGKLGRATDGN